MKSFGQKFSFVDGQVAVFKKHIHDEAVRLSAPTDGTGNGFISAIDEHWKEDYPKQQWSGSHYFDPMEATTKLHTNDNTATD
jgi:hypothetical protein